MAVPAGVPITDELIIDCQRTFGGDYEMFISWLLPWINDQGQHIIPCTEEYYYQLFMVDIDEAIGEYYEQMNY